MWSGSDGGSELYVGVKVGAEATVAEFWAGQPQCQLVCIYQYLAARSSGMILASGSGGPSSITRAAS